MSFLKMLAELKDDRSLILKSQQEEEVTLEEYFSKEERREYVQRKSTLRLVSQCSYAIEELGIRLGDEVDERCLQTLSQEERHVFHLRFIEKKGFTDIARELKTNLSNVDKIYKRVVRKVTNTLREIQK